MTSEEKQAAFREKNRVKCARQRAARKEADPGAVKARNRRRYLNRKAKALVYAAQPHVREKKASRMKAARASDPEGSRLKFRAWNYGLTVPTLAALLAGGCSVCGSEHRLHIDHDHKCCPAGASPRSCGLCVRGCLCHGCNTALGLLSESVERVQALLTHLRNRADHLQASAPAKAA